MRQKLSVDGLAIVLYLLLALLGWMAIYAVSSAYGGEGILDFTRPYGKQIIWIGLSLLIGGAIILLDNQFIQALATPGYLATIGLLILVLFIGKEVNGAKSWLIIAGQPIQPSEFAKVATALALAKYMSQPTFTVRNMRMLFIAIGIFLLPAIIVILQNDTGSALVFLSLGIVLFREGLHPLVPLALLTLAAVALVTLGLGTPWYTIGGLAGLGTLSYMLFFRGRSRGRNLLAHLLIVGLLSGFAVTVDKLVSKLPPHQQTRLMVLFDPGIDPQGSGYNVIQSKIAIGSGGLTGKGYLQGNYTKSHFVPKQDTDFIFCTIGEEYGWIGTTAVLGLFFLLLARIQFMAENAKLKMARVYGYGVLSIVFFHVLVNVGMTIGLVPVIGIPLPFFSYGGSSLLAFSILIAILLNFYAHRNSVLGNKF